MGGEDFGRYGLAGVPICMFRLGTVDQSRLDEFKEKGQSPPSLHSPRYYPNAEASLRPVFRRWWPSWKICCRRRPTPRQESERMAASGVFGRWWWLWGLVYVALLAAIIWSLFAARRWAQAELARPESTAAWETWREDVRSRPGSRRRRSKDAVPKSAEPPALVLTRDYFGVILGGALFFSTLLYWVIAWFVSGALTAPASSDRAHRAAVAEEIEREQREAQRHTREHDQPPVDLHRRDHFDSFVRQQAPGNVGRLDAEARNDRNASNSITRGIVSVRYTITTLSRFGRMCRDDDPRLPGADRPRRFDERLGLAAKSPGRGRRATS